MANDLDQAALLVMVVMLPIWFLPFLLARIEVWLATENKTPQKRESVATPGS